MKVSAPSLVGGVHFTSLLLEEAGMDVLPGLRDDVSLPSTIYGSIGEYPKLEDV